MSTKWSKRPFNLNVVVVFNGERQRWNVQVWDLLYFSEVVSSCGGSSEADQWHVGLGSHPTFCHAMWLWSNVCELAWLTAVNCKWPYVMMRKVTGCCLIRCKIRKKEATLKPVPERSKTGMIFFLNRGLCYVGITYIPVFLFWPYFSIDI